MDVKTEDVQLKQEHHDANDVRSSTLLLPYSSGESSPNSLTNMAKDCIKNTAKAKKKAKADDNLCKICCDREVKCCFVPCGHVACCLECGLKFEGGKCPICQQSVFLVVQTFVA